MNFEEIGSLIKSKLDESNEKKKVYDEAIIKAESELERATAQMNTAYDEADVKAYHKAQDAIRTAQDSKSMYSKKLLELEEKKLLKDEEYKALCDSINDEISSAEAETNEKLNAIIKELWIACVEYNQKVSEAKTLLHDLQYDIMKHYNCNASGVKIYLQSEDRSYHMERKKINLIPYVERVVSKLEGGKNYEPWVK